MDLKLNFIGLNVSNFAASLHFYTAVLGMNAKNPKPDWAFLETTGMTLELFSGGMAPTPDRAWGQGQAVRPSIQVADLPGTIAALRRKGVQFTSDIERTAAGEQIEFITPERIHWTLAHAPAYPFSTSLHRPHIGWVELKVYHLAEQRAFYSKVMGLQPEEGEDGQVVLRQGTGEPHLFLETGGQLAAAWQVNQNFLQPSPPFVISFETSNIEQAATLLKSHKVPIVVDVTRREWGGTDLLIADVDGNPIQVVQYGTSQKAKPAIDPESSR